MAKRKIETGLGRGLDALFGDPDLPAQGEGSVSLPISQVEPGLNQPRKRFDPESLADLAESIRVHGVIQPLTVRRLSSGYYQIIAGERRWRAAKAAGLDQVPAVIIEADDRKVMELGLIENLQREDLNPMEEAAGFQALIESYHMTQDEAAQRVGKSRSAVTNALRLLALSPEVRHLIEIGQLSAGHARALVPLSPALQLRAADTIIKGNLSVRQTELLVKRLSAEAEPAKKPKDADTVDYLTEAQNDLKAWLCRGVKIVPGRKKGRIELEYYGTDDLNDLLEALSVMKVKKTSKGSSQA